MASPTIDTEQQLEERLSRPSEADARASAALDGDLLILGVGGKMGPSLASLARRAALKAGVDKRIIAVARFSNSGVREQLQAEDIETIACDLLETGTLASLPDAPNVIFMAARKFGTTGAEHMSWASNTYLAGLAAERYHASRIVTFSSGNVYPLRSLAEGGAMETTVPDPAGEYAQSVLGRERMFEYASGRWGTKVAILRLNYAVELRYGVLVDIAHSVFNRQPIDLRTGYVNVIWQGDANSVCLRSLGHCTSPPTILNVTGPEILSVRELARQLGERLGIEPVFTGTEADSALLNNADKAHRLFGNPSVKIGELMDWTAHWISIGGTTHNKPTHFQVRDGKF